MTVFGDMEQWKGKKGQYCPDSRGTGLYFDRMQIYVEVK